MTTAEVLLMIIILLVIVSFRLIIYQKKVRSIYITPHLFYALQTWPDAAHAHGIWPAAIQPHEAQVSRFNGFHPNNQCKYMDYYRAVCMFKYFTVKLSLMNSCLLS